MEIFDHPYLELPDLRPTSVFAGYRFSFALTVDNLIPLRDLLSASPHRAEATALTGEGQAKGLQLVAPATSI